jgi:hypothetical protein
MHGTTIKLAVTFLVWILLVFEYFPPSFRNSMFSVICKNPPSEKKKKDFLLLTCVQILREAITLLKQILHGYVALCN